MADTQTKEVFAFDQPCPIRDVLDRIGDQWSLLVLEALQGGVLRFNELNRRIDDISKQMLSRTLKRLEEDGFIRRTLYAEVPPRVEYELTNLGRSFRRMIGEGSRGPGGFYTTMADGQLFLLPDEGILAVTYQ